MPAQPHVVFAAFSIENTRENTPETRFRTGTSYGQANHPGMAPNWHLDPPAYGRSGGQLGINTATIDGAVKWTPAGQAMLGYSGANLHILEPPRPGRPGMFP